MVLLLRISDMKIVSLSSADVIHCWEDSLHLKEGGAGALGVWWLLSERELTRPCSVLSSEAN